MELNFEFIGYNYAQDVSHTGETVVYSYKVELCKYCRGLFQNFVLFIYL